MFKSKLIIILLCLCVVAGIADAQEKKSQVIQSEPQLEDIYNVLEAMDIHMFRFELKEFLNKVYTVTAYMDEYENGKSPKQVFKCSTRRTSSSFPGNKTYSGRQERMGEYQRDVNIS